VANDLAVACWGRTIRRTVLYHAYMSYIFGTVVVAMTINVVASLLNR